MVIQSSSTKTSDFDGILKITQCGKLTKADNDAWSSLDTKMSLTISTKFSSAGSKATVSGSQVTDIVKKTLGSYLYLALAPDYENTALYLLPAQSYLEITYKSKSGSETSNNYSLLSLPEIIYSEENITLGFNEIAPDDKIIDWEYDPLLFTEVRRDKSSITLKPRQVIMEARATVKMKVERTELYIIKYINLVHIWSFSIIGTPHIKTNTKIVCSGENINYTIQNFYNEPISNIQWKAIKNSTLVSSGLTGTFKTYGNGYIDIESTVRWKGKTYNLKNSDIWVGSPSPQNDPSLSYEGKVGYSQAFTVEFDGVDDTTTYTWKITSGSASFTATPLGNTIWLIPNNSNLFSLRVDVTNKCGTGTGLYLLKAGSNSGSGLTTLNLKSSIISDSMFTPRSLKIYNLSGVLVYTQDNLSGNFDIKSTTLPDGIYIIEKSDGKEKQSKKIMKSSRLLFFVNILKKYNHKSYIIERFPIINIGIGV